MPPGPARKPLLLALAALLLSAPAQAADVLLVTAGSSLTSQETLRKTQFEAWGHTVTTIEDGGSQANFDTAMASADVVWVTEEVSASSVGYKLRTATIGVVHGEAYLDDEMGFAPDYGEYWNSSSVTLTDNTHEITTGLTLGTLTLTSVTESLIYTYGTEAPGAQALAEASGGHDLAVLEPGATLANTYSGNSTASGRRVRLPWGGDTFDWSNLNSTGLLIAQRAIDWAAGGVLDTDTLGLKVLVVITSGGGPSAAEQLRIDQFEAWGCTVTTLYDGSSQAAYEAAAAAVDVVWVSPVSNYGQVAYNLRHVTTGVVYAHNYLDDYMGFATQSGWYRSTTDINAIDTTHAVSQDLALGTNTLFTTSIQMSYTRGTLGAGVRVLSDYGSAADLAVLERGTALANTYDGNSTAAGRRVRLPWGRGDGYWSYLTDEGLDLAKRALVWAAGDGLVLRMKLNETSGTAADDIAENDNDGTYTGGVTLNQTGPHGGPAARFDGSTGYIAVPNESDYDLVDGITVSAWVRIDSFTTEWEPVITKGD